MILRHLDLDTIRSRISRHSIMSVKELFRDLLLLANNAVVFYSKNTREYKSAFLLRTIVLKSMCQHFKDNDNGNNKPTTSMILSSSPPMHKLPVKPRTARPGRRKLSLKAGNAGNFANKLKVANTGNFADKPPPSIAKKLGDAHSPPPPPMESIALAEKSLPRKVGCRITAASRGRKRIRDR